MDQGQAEQGALALVLIAPPLVVVVDDGGLGCRGGGLLSGDQVVQGDIEITGQGGQVVHVGAGGARLPLLDRLPGDPQQVGQPLLAQPRLFAQVIETLLKIHGCDLQKQVVAKDL